MGRSSEGMPAQARERSWAVVVVRGEWKGEKGIKSQ